MGFLGFNFNLTEQLGFYGSYHRHPVNKLIHFFFVPLIFWSVMVLLEYPPQISERLDIPSALSSFLPDALADLFVINWAVVLLLVYAIYYTILEPFAGISWFIVLGIPKVALARLFFLHMPHAWAAAIGLHFLGWFMQSLVLAGLFAWMEGLFALGYRPGLQEELHRQIEARDASSQREALLKSDQDRASS